MLNCHNATRLMSEKLERTLSFREATKLRVHLMMCKGCRNFDEHMGSLRQITRAYAKGLGAAAPLPHDDNEPPKP